MTRAFSDCFTAGIESMVFYVPPPFSVEGFPIKRVILCLLALLVATLRPHQATAAVATVAGDAYTSSTSPNTNYGSATSLLVKGPPATTAVADAYVQFDLSSLPPGTTGADVAKATLSVAINSVSTAGSFDVFRVTSAWTESGIKASVSPTLGGTPEVSGVVVALTDKKNFKTVDVTQLVKDWLDNVLPNAGIALVPNVAGLSAKFDSKENTTTSHPAQLDIELGTVTSFSGNLSGDVSGTQTATHVGKINGAPLGSLGSATSGQALTFSGSNWSPSSVVNSVTAGSGLSASGSTGNVSMSVPNGGVTNSMLTNSSVTVSAGTGLSGGGAVALGGSTTLNNAGVLSVGAGAPLASSGGQSPSISLTGTVPVANGGTGATTPSGARANLGTASSGANSDITALSGITGNIVLPESTSAAAGNVLKGGTPFIHDFGTDNTFVGENAGNFAMSGIANTALGFSALQSNSTGANNTAVGQGALQDNSNGQSNTAVGAGALSLNAGGGGNVGVGVGALASNNTGNNNTALGDQALVANTGGAQNTAVGQAALQSNSTANNNTALGFQALQANTGEANTAVGSAALLQNTGGGNIAIGSSAGAQLTTGNSNIDVGNGGVAGESATIRIGTGSQTATYIAGISGATSSSGVAVYVNSSGQLGTITSSARFKDDIQDMGDSTSGLMKLRPVRFRYKQDIDPSGLEQYGLVAEEVAKVYPDLVVYDDKGQPQTVRYHFVNAMLLNEVQKQARQMAAQRQRIADQAHQMRTQGEQIEALSVRLLQVEAVLGTQGRAPAVEAGYTLPPGL